MRKISSGFTLIELVIVIAIIGILASMAMPKYLDVSDASKEAAHQAALGAVRSALATKYAASATGGQPATWPAALSGTDFANGEFPYDPTNLLGFGPDWQGANAVPEIPDPNCTPNGYFYWYVSDGSSPNAGQLGNYDSSCMG